MTEAERDLSGLNPFIAGMVEKLNENGHKGGWVQEDISELYWCLEHEVREELRLDLDTYIIAAASGYGETEAKRALEAARRECYDVANFAYFITDKINSILKEIDERRQQTD